MEPAPVSSRDAEQRRDALVVDHLVGQRRGDDLAAQTVLADLVGVAVGQLVGEVAEQEPVAPRIFGQVALDELTGEEVLGVGEQHRELGRREPLPLGFAAGDVLVGGQRLDLAVDQPFAFEPVQVPLVDIDQRRCLHHGVDERLVLADVVGQDQLADLVGHRGEQRVTLLARQVACRHHRVDHDLDVDLVIGRVDACGVVDGVGVDPTTELGELDPCGLGHPEVAAFADHPAPQLRGIDPHRVVGLVAHLGVGLGAGLDVGPDAAVPQQIDRRLEQGVDQPVGRQRLDLDAEQFLDLRGEPDRLRRPRVHAAPLGDQRPVVVIPGRARHVEQPLPLGEGGLGVWVRIEEHVEVVERGDQLQVLRLEHPIAEHVAGHVADAHHRDRLALDVDVELAEVPLDRLPRAAGGDAHLLVVVPRGATRRERVAQPEVVGGRDLVGDVGERRRSLVGGHDEVRVVVVEADHVLWRLDAVTNEVVGEVEQAADERAVALDDLLAKRVRVRPEAASRRTRPWHRRGR